MDSIPIRSNDPSPKRPIVLTSHPRNAVVRHPVVWGAGEGRARGPWSRR